MTATADTDLVPLDRVRNSMSRLWFLGSGLIFTLLVVQTVLGKYDLADEVQKVWSWFVPTTIPTLSLMVGVLGGSTSRQQATRFCTKGFKTLAFWLSLAYLSALAATILLQPLSKTSASKLFQVSNYYLTPIQGLVVTAIGFIFTSTRESKTATSERQTPASESD